MVLSKASRRTSNTNVIYSEVRESRARGVPSHHCSSLPSLSPVRDRTGKDAPRSHCLSVGGDKSTASLFQVDKLACCWHGISQTDRCLSTAPGTRPQHRLCFVTARKKKKKRNKGKKSDVILIAHPSLQKPPETGGINLKTTQCYHHPSRRHPNATPPCSLFCKPLSQCFFSLLNRQQRFASLCVKKHKVVGIFLSLTFFGSLNGKILANETLINGKS